MNSCDLIKQEGGLAKQVGKAIAITNKLLACSTPKIRMLYYSPWALTLRAYRELVIPKIPEVTLETKLKFTEALTYIEYTLEKNEQIDLIFTEFVGAEMNAYEFASKVREMEKQFNKHSYIVLMSVYEKNELMKRGLFEGIFDEFLSFHTMGSEEIVAYIKNLFLIQ